MSVFKARIKQGMVCCSMGPEFDPVETAENSVQDEMPQLVKPQSGKEDFYNRHTAVATA